MKRVMVFWLASLVLVSMATFALAQTRFPEQHTISGSDIGFRVEGVDIGGKPVGTLMLRINGKWIEVGASVTARPAK